jgi:hypothetical protein
LKSPLLAVFDCFFSGDTSPCRVEFHHWNVPRTPLVATIPWRQLIEKFLTYDPMQAENGKTLLLMLTANL